MPLYQYKCKNCEHSFNKLLKIANMNDPLEQPCTECNKKEIQKQITVSHISRGVMGVGGLKKPDWFKDKIKDMKKNVGKGHTLDQT